LNALFGEKGGLSGWKEKEKDIWTALRKAPGEGRRKRGGKWTAKFQSRMKRRTLEKKN